MASRQRSAPPRDHEDSSEIQLKSSYVLHQSVREVPVMRPLAKTILRKLDDPDADFNTVRSIVQHDPSLCAYIIRCATALMSEQDPKPSLLYSLKWLGLERIRHVVTFHESNNYFTTPEPPGFDREKLWTYCHAVACLGKLISEKKGYSSEKEDRIFSAGLLHSLGLAWMNEHVPEQFEKIVREANLGDTDFVKLEQDFLGVTHGEVAERIYRKWDLDDSICRATRFYQSPFEVDGYLPKVIHLCSALARSFGYTRGLREDRLYIDGRVLRSLGLSNQDVLELMRYEYPARFKENVDSLSTLSTE